MALPGNLTTITVTGSYMTVTGAPAGGTVLFTPSAPLCDIAGTTILTDAPIVAPLTAGAFTVTLPCTDNTAVVPNPFYYTVTQAIACTYQTPFNITLPHTLGTTVDMSTLIPAPVMAQPQPGLYVISLNGQTGAISIPQGTITLAAGGATVTTTAITATSRIFLTTQAPGGTPGAVYVNTITAGTGFTIRSTSGTDTSLVAWMIWPLAA